jgi:nicotinamidase-related amidase
MTSHPLAVTFVRPIDALAAAIFSSSWPVLTVMAAHRAGNLVEPAGIGRAWPDHDDTTDPGHDDKENAVRNTGLNRAGVSRTWP